MSILGEKKGVEALLSWCRTHAFTHPTEQIEIKDWTSSWQDGMAFCAILYTFEPQSIPFLNLTREDPIMNMNLAFDAAEKLGIPKLLDPQDVIDSPTASSILTYVAQYYYSFGDSFLLSIIPRDRLKSVSAKKMESTIEQPSPPIDAETEEDVIPPSLDDPLSPGEMGKLEKSIASLDIENPDEFEGSIIIPHSRDSTIEDESEATQVSPSDLAARMEAITQMEKIAKLRRLLIVAVEVISFKILDAELILQFAMTVDEILSNRSLIQAVVECVKVLEDVAVQDSIESSTNQSFYAQELSPKLADFHREMDMIFWEIRAKIRSIQSDTRREGNLEKLISHAAMLKSMKENLRILENDPSYASKLKSPEVPVRHKRSLSNDEDYKNILEAAQIGNAEMARSDAASLDPIATVDDVDVDVVQESPSQEGSPDNSEVRDLKNRMSMAPRKESLIDVQDDDDPLHIPCILDLDDADIMAEIRSRSPKTSPNQTPRPSESNVRVPFLQGLLHRDNRIDTSVDHSEEYRIIEVKPREDSWSNGTMVAHRGPSQESSQTRLRPVTHLSKPINQSQKPMNHRSMPIPMISKPMKKREMIMQTVKTSQSFTSVIVKKGYLVISTDLHTFQNRYCEVDAENISFYKFQSDNIKSGLIIIETVLGIKRAQYQTKKQFSLQIFTSNRSTFLVFPSEKELRDWNDILEPLCIAAQKRLREFSEKLEPDGTLVLTVIVPEFQETKRLKFSANVYQNQVKTEISTKFPKCQNMDLSKYGLWNTKLEKWLPEDVFLGDFFKTQDVLELRSLGSNSGDSISGYLWKQDPRGFPLKSWRKRFFLLKNSKLSYSHTEKQVNAPINFIDLSSFKVRMLPEMNDLIFSVAVPTRTYLLQGSTVDEVKRWVGALREIKSNPVNRDSSFWIREVTNCEREGWMFKLGETVRAWRQRWFVMRDGFLHYYKVTPRGKERKGSIPLYGAQVEKTTMSSNRLAFHLVTLNRIYQLYAETDQDTSAWINALRLHKRDVELKVNSIVYN
eukprot:TRINITY_DN5204_c0_g1_i4.p1 TRINITY_DN5204_c0_g1~~TRINITY_DN5204_c0_g1_i4.p1  ORF type:complete len:1020 (-),score=255.23 TRINITY_DN5204_c0_g1_i4:16-3075(-)